MPMGAPGQSTEITEATEPPRSDNLRPERDWAHSRDDVTGAIIGAAIHVQRQLGCGFLEAVYQSAMACEFRRRQIPFEREVPMPVWYEGERLEVNYRVDFLCSDVVVELKALDRLGPLEESQVLNYLKVKGGGRALLLNFGTPLLGIKRFVL